MAVLSRIATTCTAGIRNLTPSLRIVRSLHFATAAAATATAQLQLDHDGDYDYRQSPASVAAVDTDNLSPIRGVQWVFIGNPNAKKHIYAHMVSKLLQVPRISISTLLRQDLNPHSPLYRKIADAVNCGKPVPESIIFGLLSKRLEDGHYRGENGFILDGIPRTRLQAEILDELVDIDLVVNFKCSEDHFEIAGSPADSTAPCGRSKSSFPGLSRTNENSEFKVNAFYREQMQFLEAYYQNQNKLIDFLVGDAPGDNWKGLLAALHLQHINAVHSSKTLTMNFRIP